MQARAFLVAALLPLAASAQSLGDIQQAATTISNMHVDVGRGDMRQVDVAPSMKVLDAAIEKRGITPGGMATVHYYRAIGAMVTNQVRRSAGQPVDPKLSAQALADLEAVLAFGRDLPDASVSMANAAYYAGAISRIDNQDDRRAYGYWQRCASLGHAGCQGIMARAYVGGSEGIAPDLQRAVSEHMKVFKTGTAYTCAGVQSGLEMSRIAYFGGVRADNADEREWIRRTYTLQGSVADEKQNRNACEPARIAVSEYLMLLGAGQSRPELLRNAASRAGSSDQKLIAEYLLGRVGEDSYRRAISMSPDKERACEMHFAALWRAEISKDMPLAGEHRKQMGALGGGVCRSELALAAMKFK